MKYKTRQETQEVIDLIMKHEEEIKRYKQLVKQEKDEEKIGLYLDVIRRYNNTIEKLMTLL